ncbi:MAG TPA: extracellular solute-binding protein [Acidimicrobiales bacterium]|nr:extracellular solute-binding protein [Acidimicrobiales bacterium]
MILNHRMSRAAVLLVAVLVGAACGGSGEAAPTTLRVMMTDDWTTPPVLDAVRDFERLRPDVRVVVDKAPIRNMLDHVKGTASPPDVVQSHAFAAAARGMAEPLDDLWDKALRPSEFFPGALDDVTFAGHRYGVPLDTNALVLLYNADHFRAAGLPLPQRPLTFPQLEEVARALTTPDGRQRALALGTSTWQTFGWVSANGGEYVRVTDDGRPQFMFDSPAVVDTIAFLAGLVRKGLAHPPRAADTHSSDVYALFESGATSMYTSAAWDIAKLRRAQPGVDYRAMPMPTGMSGTTQGSAMGGSSLFVPKGSKHRELAFDFMTHLISDRYALRLAREQGRLPVRSRVYTDPFFEDPLFRLVLEQLQTARPERIDSYPDAGKLLANAIDQSLREAHDPAVALREAQVNARASVGTS